MSYASIAASGPKQTDEEKRAPAIPALRHEESDLQSLGDDDSLHISSVPSDFESQDSEFDAQPEDEEVGEAEEEVKEKVTETKEKATETKDKAGVKKQQIKEKAKEVGSEAKVKATYAKEKAKEKASQAQGKARDAGEALRANSDNPVVVGNAVAIAVLGSVLGFGAYRKHAAGELTWRIAGIWAGAVGLFGVADYYVSQYLFKSYPPK